MSVNEPNSRNEAILKSIVDGTEYTDPPQSRIEDLLLQVKEAIEEGGGGGGTDDYTKLKNKPTINDEEIVGNLTTEDIGIVDGYNATYDNQSENLVLTRG